MLSRARALTTERRSELSTFRIAPSPRAGPGDYAIRAVDYPIDGGGPNEGAFNGTRLASVIAASAARFVTVDTEAIDDAIVDCLRQVAEELQLDRAILWIGNRDSGITSVSHHWMKSEPGRPAAEPPMPVKGPELDQGEILSFLSTEECPSTIDREAFDRCGFRVAIFMSVPLAGQPYDEHAILAFGSAIESDWPPPGFEHVRVVAAIIGQALTRKQNALELQHARVSIRQREHEAEAHRHRHAGSRSADLYRRDVPEQSIKATIIGQSRALRRVLDQIQQVAVTDSTVLLLGETGVGKEVLATHLHELSARRGRPMVRVNCSAIPSTLIESELFGREKGAYTGSLARQIGRFELADRSTIFLDEIGDLPAEVQVKLLRVLEERQIERLGSPQGIKVDVRIVAATHRKLDERIMEGAFREDLFYRLNVFPIQVPPLRERAEDIPSLAWLFVDEFSRAFGKRIDAIPRDNMDALQRHAWPGNIRELRNVVERAMIVATGTRLTIALPVRADAVGLAARRSLKLVDVEKDHIRSVVESTGWRIRGVGGAAELLGLQPTTLETRMSKLGLVRPRH